MHKIRIYLKNFINSKLTMNKYRLGLQHYYELIHKIEPSICLCYRINKECYVLMPIGIGQSFKLFSH